MSGDLKSDPGLPPGVTDDMTEARSLTPITPRECPECDGHGVIRAIFHDYTCPRCNGTGVEE